MCDPFDIPDGRWDYCTEPVPLATPEPSSEYVRYRAAFADRLRAAMANYFNRQGAGRPLGDWADEFAEYLIPEPVMASCPRPYHLKTAESVS